jgi:branched-chain amino acid transport system permease protein
VLTAIVLALVMMGASFYHRSKVARVLVAVRDDELLTRSLGFEVPAYKVIAFALSAALASLAGVLYAWFIQFIAPGPFTFFAISFPVFVMVAVGGPGSLWGPLVGASFLTALPELLHVEAQTKQILYGGILLLAVIFMRRGIAPTASYYANLAFEKLIGRRGSTVDAALPPAARAGEGLSGASPSDLERV